MAISEILTALVDRLGVVGIGLGVFLNGLGIPGLSEVLVPLGGIAVHQGRLSLAVLLAVTFTAQLGGYLVAYWIARKGGVPIIERYGKYVLISSHELEATERAFDRYGRWVVLVGGFIPGIQGFIGYAAGLAKMNIPTFLLAAFVGKLVWIGGLVYLGVILGDNLELIDRAIKQTGIVVLAVVLGLGALYIWKKRRRKDVQG